MTPSDLDLEEMATAQRVLASRVAELEAEVTRQSEVAERLRQRLAEVMADELTAREEADALQATVASVTAELAEALSALDDRTAELAGLRATRLFSWSARPRGLYGKLRRTLRRSHPG